MGNHIDSQGHFQSDLHPNLKPDRIVLSFKDPLARRALRALAVDYREADSDLARDIQKRLMSIDSDPAPTPEAQDDGQP